MSGKETEKQEWSKMPVKLITKTCELCGQELAAISEADVLNQLKNHRNGRKCKFRQRLKKRKQ